MSDNPRKDDEIVARMDQKLDDFIKRFDDHLRWSGSVSDKVEIRISALEKLWIQIERPIKFVGWTVTLFVTGILLFYGEKFAAWISKNFHG